MTDSNDKDIGPWYQQFWAWFILTPLIVVVLVCAVLVTIAYKGADDRVIDNYYKEGRLINQRFDEDQRAVDLGLSGKLFLDLDVGEVLLSLTATSADYDLPATLDLYLDHPIEADSDVKLVLQESTPGRYHAELTRRLKHRWYVRLVSESAPVESSQADTQIFDTQISDTQISDTQTSDPQALEYQTVLNNWRMIGELDLSQGSRLTLGRHE